MAKPLSIRKKDHIHLLTWNVENLFHPASGGPRNDLTPHEGWTLPLYREKIQRIGNVLSKIIAQHAEEPWIIGLTEIENEQVIRDLLKLLPKGFRAAFDKEFRHEYHDTALLFDSRHLNLKKVCHHETFTRYQKGDVLQVNLQIRTTKTEITTFVCHLKARPHSRYHTATYRQAVCDNLQTEIWRMHGGENTREQLKALKGEEYEEAKKSFRLSQDVNAVIMGDMNDEPFSASLTDYLRATYDREFVIEQCDLNHVSLYNASWEGLVRKNPGSLYYERSPTSHWSMLDQIIVTPALARGIAGLRYSDNSFSVVQNLTADNKGRPLSCRDWDDEGNPIWREGFSDHFPVYARLEATESK